MSYSGFWIRVVAYLIDSVLLFFINTVLEVLVGPVGLLLAILLTLGYYVGMTGYRGQTLGKMAMGIKVTTIDGGVPGLGKAALREIIGKIVSTIVLDLGFFWVAFDSKKQGWHDKIAGTVVVPVRQAEALAGLPEAE